MEEKRIPVEICGEKWYLTEKELQKVKAISEKNILRDMKTGSTREEAEAVFGIRILKEE